MCVRDHHTKVQAGRGCGFDKYRKKKNRLFQPNLTTLLADETLHIITITICFSFTTEYTSHHGLIMSPVSDGFLYIVVFLT